MQTYQVITGDVQASAEMSIGQRESLRRAFSQLAGESQGKYEYFIRGDSFQILLQENALRECLRLKTYLHGELSVQVRVSIGIGEVSLLRERISDSDGEAFWYSGRTLEQMKAKDQWTRITTANEYLNEEWNIHTATLDYLEISRTENQSQALYWLLLDRTQQEIAKRLGISQPSVHSRLKGAGWPLIEKILHRYEQMQAVTSNSPRYAVTV